MATFENVTFSATFQDGQGKSASVSMKAACEIAEPGSFQAFADSIFSPIGAVIGADIVRLSATIDLDTTAIVVTPNSALTVNRGTTLTVKDAVGVSTSIYIPATDPTDHVGGVLDLSSNGWPLVVSALTSQLANGAADTADLQSRGQDDFVSVTRGLLTQRKV